MELKQYLKILFKRLWIIIVLPVVAAGVASYVSFYILDSVYEANTTLYVINKKADFQPTVAYNELMAGQYLVKDYRELIKSRTVTETVINELKLEHITPEALAKKISVNAKNDTRLIEIKVQDSYPNRAKDIANKVANVFINKVIEWMRAENVSIIDDAKIPASPVKPDPLMNIVIAALVGLMAAVGIVFLIEYLDDTIKTAEDVEKYLDLTVLGTIPVLNLK